MKIKKNREMFDNSHRRQHGNIRLLEKQLRPEVIERTLQFLDTVIHQILYQEKIYHSGETFVKE